MKKIIILMVSVMLIAVFSGCSLLPKATTNGIAVGERYPGKADGQIQEDEQKPDSDTNDSSGSEEIEPAESDPADAGAPAEQTLPADSDVVAPPAGIRYNPIDYVIQQDSDITDELLEIIESRKMNPTAEIIKEEDGYKIALISLGEKSTGGYNVNILEVADLEAGKITVSYSEMAPAADDMVIQVITYPYVVLKINSDLPVEFKQVDAAETAQDKAAD